MDMNYSLADMAAATGGNMQGGNLFWIVVLFLLMGRGGWGGTAAEQGALTRAELFDGLNYTQLENAVRGVQQGLCDGFYAQNTTMLQGFNGIQNAMCQGFNGISNGLTTLGYNMQNCCCETNRNIDNTKFEVVTNSTAGTQKILDKLCDMESNRKDERIRDLEMQLQSSNFQISQISQTRSIVDTLSPQPRPAYITYSPYESISDKFARGGNCGCGCGCYA